MKETFISRGIILNRQEYGENDLLVNVLSADRGRMDVVAKGGKKMGSKLAPHLEPFTLTDVMVVKGKSRDYAGSAVGRSFYSGIKNDLTRVYYAGAAARILWKHIQPEAEDACSYFRLFQEFLDLLEQEDSPELSIYEFFYVRFLGRFFHIYGIEPDISGCSQCGRTEFSGGAFFSPSLGGVVCNKCYPQNKGEFSGGSLTISHDCITLLKLILASDDRGEAETGNEVLKDQTLIREASNILHKFYLYHIR